MKIEKSTVSALHEKYIKNTAKDEAILDRMILVCNLTSAVEKGLGAEFNKVYLKSRVLKHIYDKRTAQSYDFLLRKLVKIVKSPDIIYKNHSSKRGGYILSKIVEKSLYCVVIEEDLGNDSYQIVTVFPTDEEYLGKFKKIWSWKGGNLHRNTLDAI